MDGKTANSSSRTKSKNGEVSKMNAMSLYSIKSNCTEAAEFIEDKTNEIPTGTKKRMEENKINRNCKKKL